MAYNQGNLEVEKEVDVSFPSGPLGIVFVKRGYNLVVKKFQPLTDGKMGPAAGKYVTGLRQSYRAAHDTRAMGWGGGKVCWPERELSWWLSVAQLSLVIWETWQRYRSVPSGVATVEGPHLRIWPCGLGAGFCGASGSRRAYLLSCLCLQFTACRIYAVFLCLRRQ